MKFLFLAGARTQAGGPAERQKLGEELRHEDEERQHALQAATVATEMEVKRGKWGAACADLSDQ
jgi:hypothetical protein